MRVGDSSFLPPPEHDRTGREIEARLMKKVEAYYEKSTGHKAKNSQEALGWLRSQLTPSKKEEERAIDRLPADVLGALNDAYVAKNGRFPESNADLLRWFDQGK